MPSLALDGGENGLLIFNHQPDVRFLLFQEPQQVCAEGSTTQPPGLQWAVPTRSQKDSGELPDEGWADCQFEQKRAGGKGIFRGVNEHNHKERHSGAVWQTKRGDGTSGRVTRLNEAVCPPEFQEPVHSKAHHCG